jgi:hypothetical protein
MNKPESFPQFLVKERNNNIPENDLLNNRPDEIHFR